LCPPSSDFADRARTLTVRHPPNAGATASIAQQITSSSDARLIAVRDDRDMRAHSPKVEHAVEKVHALEHTADVGESPKTPLILLGEVWVVSSAVVLVIVALSLLAYRLAS
jgi:hypothetical protein